MEVATMMDVMTLREETEVEKGNEVKNKLGKADRNKEGEMEEKLTNAGLEAQTVLKCTSIIHWPSAFIHSCFSFH